MVLGIGTAVFSGSMSRSLSSSDAVAAQADRYLVISAAAVPAMLVVLAATGALRGVLDLRTPLVVAAVANVLNVVLNVVLVYGFDLGIGGAATGTVIAQWVAALWLGVVVVRRAAGARARPSARRSAPMVQAGRDGVPLLVRTATLRASLVLATAVAADLGDVPLAAQQVATAVVTFLAFGLDAIAIAGQALTGRTLGAGDAAGTRALTRRMVAWGVGTGLRRGGRPRRRLTAARPALQLPTRPCRTALVPALLVVALIQPLSGVVFVLDGVLIGAGDGAYLAWAGLAVLAVYAPCALAVGVARRELHLALGGVRRLHRGPAGDAVAAPARRPVARAWRVRQGEDVETLEYAPGRLVDVHHGAGNGSRAALARPAAGHARRGRSAL